MSISTEELDRPGEPASERPWLYLVTQEGPDQDDDELAILAVSGGEVPGASLDWLSREVIASLREEVRTMAEYMRGTSVLEQAGVKFQVPIDNILNIVPSPSKTPGNAKLIFKLPIAGVKGNGELGRQQKSVTTSISNLLAYVGNVRLIDDK